jgi:GH18 family chitinase
LESDAPNYLATLKSLRKELPAKFSLSIAAPASYGYLKAFPIGDMAEVVDYIVYMPYDLHGRLFSIVYKVPNFAQASGTMET